MEWLPRGSHCSPKARTSSPRTLKIRTATFPSSPVTKRIVVEGLNGFGEFCWSTTAAASTVVVGGVTWRYAIPRNVRPTRLE